MTSLLFVGRSEGKTRAGATWVLTQLDDHFRAITASLRLLSGDLRALRARVEKLEADR